MPIIGEVMSKKKKNVDLDKLLGIPKRKVLSKKMVDSLKKKGHVDPHGFAKDKKCRASLWNPCPACCKIFYAELDGMSDAIKKLKSLKEKSV